MTPMAQKLSNQDWDQLAAGSAKFSQGEYENALAILSFLQSRTTDPQEIATVLLGEAQCYRLLERFVEAHAACDRALDLSKGNEEGTVSGWIAKTDILVDQNRLADAHSVIEASLRRHPIVNRSEQLRRKADILVRQGREAEAIPILNQLLAAPGLEEPEIAAVHHTIGVSYGALGNLGEATDHLLKAQSLQLSASYSASNRFWLASIMAKQRDFMAAKKHLLNALAQAEHSNTDLLVDIYESLANVSRELGDERDAARFWHLWKAAREKQ